MNRATAIASGSLLEHLGCVPLVVAVIDAQERVLAIPECLGHRGADARKCRHAGQPLRTDARQGLQRLRDRIEQRAKEHGSGCLDRRPKLALFASAFSGDGLQLDLERAVVQVVAKRRRVDAREDHCRRNDSSTLSPSV